MPLTRFLTFTVRVRIGNRDERTVRDEVSDMLGAELAGMALDGLIEDYDWSVGTSEERRPDA